MSTYVKASSVAELFAEVSGMTDRLAPEGAVVLHLRHLHTRNCRTQTIYNRRRALARLSKWASGPILYLPEEDLLRWEDDRSDQISPAARASELSSVREFYRWALREHLITLDPTVRLSMPRAPRRLPRPIGDADLAEAIRRADARLAAILGLAAFAGLRACEVARLDWAEVGLTEKPPMIRIIDGKGGHGRLVPLAPALTALLEALPGRRGPVITHVNGSRANYTPNGISGLSNRYLHRVGVRETFHQLRHRFGTQTYRVCRDIRAVQDLLGHSSPTTTAQYASPSPSVALEAVLGASLLA